MTRVSKKKLRPDIAKRLGDQLIESIVQARTKRDAAFFIDELLTETERIMLAKRFAIIAMLARGYSFGQIEKLLKVSGSTIVLTWRSFKNGQYPHLVHYAQRNPKKVEGTSFVDLLESLMTIMPPRAGKGRYRVLNRSIREGRYID